MKRPLESILQQPKQANSLTLYPNEFERKPVQIVSPVSGLYWRQVDFRTQK